jgi:ELWxxDGT repeat protein
LKEHLFFISTYTYGGELWATQSGVSPYQVKDIKPGSGGSNGSFPTLLTDHKGELYFVANDGINGNELWKSDGTSSGTVLVKNIGPGSNSVYMTGLISFGNKLVFGAGESSSSKELWVSDGTENGTKMLQEINPSIEQFSSGSRPQNFFVSNNRLYFSANDGTIGNELFMLEEAALSTEEELINQLSKVSLYPNPTSNILNIKVDNQQIQSVKIFNLLGKEVMQSFIKNNSIDVSRLSKGMYVFQIKTDKNSFSRKIIKQ